MFARLFERLLWSAAVANGLNDLACFILSRPSIVFDLNRRKHQWKSRKTLENVMSNRLADLALRACVIEHVVSDLERKPKMMTIRAERGAWRGIESAEKRADIAARCEQHRRLGLDAAHVLTDVGA